MTEELGSQCRAEGGLHPENGRLGPEKSFPPTGCEADSTGSTQEALSGPPVRADSLRQAVQGRAASICPRFQECPKHTATRNTRKLFFKRAIQRMITLGLNKTVAGALTTRRCVGGGEQRWAEGSRDKAGSSPSSQEQPLPSRGSAGVRAGPQEVVTTLPREETPPEGQTTDPPDNKRSKET